MLWRMNFNWTYFKKKACALCVCVCRLCGWWCGSFSKICTAAETTRLWHFFWQTMNQWWMFWLIKRWRAQRTVVIIVNCRIPWTNWILIYLPVGNAYWHVCFNACCFTPQKEMWSMCGLVHYLCHRLLRKCLFGLLGKIFGGHWISKKREVWLVILFNLSI